MLSFDDFWRCYPRHASKRAARTAWDRAVKRAPTEMIIAGAMRYAADPNREPEFTKHPATWLNGDCWDDDPLPKRRGKSASPASSASDYARSWEIRTRQQLAERAEREKKWK